MFFVREYLIHAMNTKRTSICEAKQSNNVVVSHTTLRSLALEDGSLEIDRQFDLFPKGSEVSS